MAKKFIDFDRQFAEMKKETMTFKVYGKEYIFPAVIPAFVPLEMARQDLEDEVSPKMMFRAAEAIFGREAIDEWTSHADFDVPRLGLILKAAFEMATGVSQGDEPEAVTEDNNISPIKKK